MTTELLTTHGMEAAKRLSVRGQRLRGYAPQAELRVQACLSRAIAIPIHNGRTQVTPIKCVLDGVTAQVMSAGDWTQADVACTHKERSGAPLHMLDVPNANGARQILQRAHPSPLPCRAPGRALWQSSRTTGTVMLGVHMVTTPLAWPRHCTPFQGLCRMASQGPSFVRCCATICPVLVSCAVHADSEAAPPPPLAASGSCLSPALQARGHSTAVRPRLTMHS